MTVNPNVMQAPCDRPDCRHVRNLLAQSVPLADLDAAGARIAVLESALREAADDIESWGAYAAEYFQTKWNLAGDVARARAIAAGTTEPKDAQ